MAAAQRKKVARRSGASRGRRNRAPASLWFLFGLLAGLGLAVLGWFQGYIPDRAQTEPVPTISAPAAEPDSTIENDSIAGEERTSHYDFFTVLPEMEVVVPEQQLSKDTLLPEANAPDNSGASYLLQVGSFRNNADAEQMKARLALLGNVAAIQVVTVNEETWHRVRIGPISGARQADEIRRMLQDNNIETLVMKASQ